MPSNKPVSIIVFDVNETLLDITTLEPLFERVFGDGAVLRTWFAELILYSQTMTLSGLYTPFGGLAVGALEMIASIRGVELTNADIDELKKRLGSMPAHTDVIPALTLLRDAGFRLVTLTNSAVGPSPTPLERAGIDGFFEQNFSVDSVQKFKPAPETYSQVFTETGVDPSELCLVACHLWDTIGAQATGLHGAFITRPNNAVLPAAEVLQPDITSADLADLADLAAQIIGRWKV